MAGQINYWVSEDEWERFYDDEIVTVKNVHFNYNFHDADWNQIANSGGNQRYIIDPENGAEVLDEVGKNIGFMQRKADVDPTLWETYDPEDDSGTITFEDVTEIRYETRSWESVTNKFRDEDDNGLTQTFKFNTMKKLMVEIGQNLRALLSNVMDLLGCVMSTGELCPRRSTVVRHSWRWLPSMAVILLRHGKRLNNHFRQSG